MTSSEKMLRMFKAVHVDAGGSCNLEVIEDECGEPKRVDVMKDGKLCWSAEKTDLLFDYITLDWGDV